MRRGRPGLAPLELALALLFVFMVLALHVIEKTSSVTTYAQYAVTMTAQTADDVDLYVRDPAGNIAWYGALQAGPVSLVHDSIPGATDPVSDGEHEETVLRESAPGEYVANVHYYSASDRKPVVATVKLWDLRGSDKVILTRQVTLTREGQQVTAFRWRLNREGRFAGSSTLAADLLRQASYGG